MARSKRILVTNRAGIGDVILSTSVLRGLKEKFPDSHLALLVGTNVFDLMVGLPFIDEVITYERDQDSLFRIVKQVWRYDVAICLDFTYRSALLAFLAAIPVRAGLRHKRGIFLTHATERDPKQEEIYEPYNFANIIKRTTGIELTGDLTKLEVGAATVQDRQKVDTLFTQAGIKEKMPVIAIVPFSSANAKNWPLEAIQQLIVQLKAEHDYTVVLLGAHNERDQAAVLQGAENWLGLTTLTEMAEILRRCQLFIGHCSGPIHLAAAVGVPIVALYGATSSLHWAPKNHTAVVEHPMSCTPCDATGFQCSHKQCMKSITVEEVLKACEKFGVLHEVQGGI
ncbi:heptosyltransferase-2 [Sporomusaceae bacterium BoRhaA]|uniref:lipopolysaccharide heptosyltransferase II n=1 Tax=Pelorhabdus rhamnosifermentans TaxID=2772457 RepID=UPI001C06160E|nr:lipopolysaccharide heptosyltransferase II [Pelorhabdus rhamnosifermentans]MBU2699024.1 heptosyltransferase-2 [Pelorhabdus rhamnosifermentans]